MTEFKIALLRAKMVAKKHICRAVEMLIKAGLAFADAVRMSLIFAGA
jgi:hypothetical protein